MKKVEALWKVTRMIRRIDFHRSPVMGIRIVGKGQYSQRVPCALWGRGTLWGPVQGPHAPQGQEPIGFRRRVRRCPVLLVDLVSGRGGRRQPTGTESALLWAEDSQGCTACQTLPYASPKLKKSSLLWFDLSQDHPVAQSVYERWLASLRCRRDMKTGHARGRGKQ